MATTAPIAAAGIKNLPTAVPNLTNPCVALLANPLNALSAAFTFTL